MCEFFSCLVLREGLQIKFCEEDSHETIIDRLGLEDDRLENRDFVRIELTPPTWKKDIAADEWNYRVDEMSTLPRWYDKNAKIAEAKVREVAGAVAPAWKAYQEAKAPAWKAYQEVEAPAWEAYQEVEAPAWKAYLEVEAPAWKAFQEVGAPAWEAYQEAKAPAWKAYLEVEAPAWKAYQEAKAQALKAYIVALSEIEGYVPE